MLLLLRIKLFGNSILQLQNTLPNKSQLNLVWTSLDLTARIQRILNNDASLVAMVCPLMAIYDSTVHISTQQ